MTFKLLHASVLLACICSALALKVLGHECPKWGYIDKSGKMVIQPFPGGQGPFINGVAQVWTADGSKSQYMDKSGQIIMKPTWQGVQAYGGFGFTEGLAAVNFILPNGSRCGGYIDRSGKFVIEPNFEFATPFSEGLAVVKVKDGKSGYIDKTGKFVIEPQFDMASPFRSGVAFTETGSTEFIACGPKGSVHGGKPGVVRCFDITGKELSKAEAYEKTKLNERSFGLNRDLAVSPNAIIENNGFEDIHPYRENMAAFKKNGLWGFMDSTGKVVIEPQFDRVEDFSDGLAAVHFPESNPGN